MPYRLYHSLRVLARTPTIRPVIFVAYSFGGLIAKQFLIILLKATNEDDLKFAKAVYGIVFFGVPYGGVDISSLIPMVEDGPNRYLIESIGRSDSQTQQREF
uniref:WGS project CBMG000000000 data, contig CS5907-c001337 n=1 Tax=Fusarium acuminatum CS5907 TaxID=1318461 RepID=A0A096PEQ8_9HYPO|nr:unnamed protein product [Fusarium acuminatum CS5907]